MTESFSSVYAIFKQCISWGITTILQLYPTEVILTKLLISNCIQKCTELNAEQSFVKILKWFSSIKYYIVNVPGNVKFLLRIGVTD
jgi:hypothetical protein